MTRILAWQDFNNYQLMAHSYDVGATLCDPRFVHVLGLAGEAGEVVEVIKKWNRDGGTLDLANLRSELSDCLWYLSEVSRDYGIALSDVVDTNLRKLADRRRRNVLRGKGDRR
jgi:NTP pyrophosphatase (non-canonical NTP hydrolase)